MRQDPRKIRQDFAQAAIQEEDPDRLRCLMQQPYSALTENEEQPNPNPKLPRSKNAVSE
jgi:hypothetical protein